MLVIKNSVLSLRFELHFPSYLVMYMQIILMCILQNAADVRFFKVGLKDHLDIIRQFLIRTITEHPASDHPRQIFDKQLRFLHPDPFQVEGTGIVMAVTVYHLAVLFEKRPGQVVPCPFLPDLRVSQQKCQ